MEPSGWFVVTSGPDAGRQIPVFGEEARLGRSAQCEVTLADGQASRQHASVRREEWGWIIVDLDSTNGTFVNGHRLQPNVPHLLHTDDQVQVADTLLSFQQADADAELWDNGWTDPAEAGSVPGRAGIRSLVLVMALAALALLSVLALLAVLVLNSS